MKTTRHTTIKKIMWALILSFGFVKISIAQKPVVPVAENEAKTHYMLGIIGYNYTDEHIVGFTIDGQGGGYARVSTPTTGGSGTVCCLLLSKKPKWPIHVTVRWQSGGCKVYSKNRKYSHDQYYYREAVVNVEKGSSSQPSDIAVHFYKNGSVRVRLVDDIEPPLLKLPNDRAIEREYPECKRGEPIEYL